MTPLSSTPSWAAPTAARGVTAVEVTTTQEFARLREEWGELLGSTAAGGVFLTWEWLYTWWKHLAEGRQLRLMTVRRGSTLIALAPLAVTPPPALRLAPFPSLEFLGTGSVGSDYLDVLIARGHEDEALDRLAARLAGQDLAIGLAQVNRRGSMSAELAERLRRRGWQCAERPTEICPVIALGGHTWPSYLASLHGQHRHNWRRRLRGMEQEFEVRVERVGTEAERGEALAALFRLHARRWETRGGSTAFHSPALRAFHEEWSQVALARGWLRLYLMRLNGEPVAALYGFRYGDVFSFYQTGFDPGYARHGVGQVLLGLTIQSAIEEGVVVYDLLHGDERYKFNWAREVAELVRIELYPPSWRGRIHRGLTRLDRAARGVARELIPRTPVGGRPDAGQRV
jgi:CelD/BcsL family acetyltransferase involved in cellulose biosynthesis